MSDNSNNRRKTLIVSMLAFLLIGGGVFLFFIIQGSNDLTNSGKKNNFHYGTAAREGVSSFFKAVGIIPDEEEALVKHKEVRMKARGFLEDGAQAGVTDVSDWMASNSAAAPSGAPSRPGPTAVPRMAGGSRSSAGGSGGGTKSAGGVSRFGGGSPSGTTAVSNKAKSGFGEPAGKGTLGALRNARAMLSDGLKSGSAMTASSKWGQSFGVGGGAGGGGGKSGDLAYGKSGLVNLDKIKSGDIASLKGTPEASAFKRDKDAESKDKNLNDIKDKASEKSKEDTKAKEKEAIAKTLAEAGTGALSKGLQSESGGSGPAADPGKAEITDEEKQEAKDLAFFDKTDLGDGSSFQDSKVDIVRNPDGGCTYTISGTMMVDGVAEPYSDIVVKAKDGTLTFK